MARVICEPCIGVCDMACVPVCPTQCIHAVPGFKKGDSPAGKQLYINPDDCIDCGACVPECPVQAIYPEEEVPAKWKSYIQTNRDFFKKK